MLTCRAGFKQNVGHLGTEIVVCGVHGHNRTMKLEFGPTVWKNYWDQLAEEIQEFGIKFVAGDFNMSLTEVPNQLRSRGIQCDCVAWYPWQQVTAVADAHPANLQKAAGGGETIPP